MLASVMRTASHTYNARCHYNTANVRACTTTPVSNCSSIPFSPFHFSCSFLHFFNLVVTCCSFFPAINCARPEEPCGDCNLPAPRQVGRCCGRAVSSWGDGEVRARAGRALWRQPEAHLREDDWMGAGAFEYLKHLL